MAVTDEQRRQLIESFRNQTDEEADAIWEEMVRDGIIDKDGNVLKKIPEPPDWLLEASRNGRAPKAETPAEPAKRARRPRKRA
jgi:hypothetical protein